MPITLPGDLLDSFRTNRVHLFVGSGVSAACGLLGWNGLIDEMKTIISREDNRFPKSELVDFLASADHLDIAEHFRNTVGEHRYYSILRQKYRLNVKLSSLHNALSKLPIKTIFTTNYDKLLEASYRKQTKMDPSVIVDPRQLGYIDETEFRIIKLHGDIDYPSTIVLTRQDYASYGARHEGFVRELHRSINNFTMLFVGFGLRDSNFRRIYDDARTLYDSGHRHAYAIMPGTNAVDRAIWDTNGLKILSVPSYKQVPNCVRQILTSI